MSDCPANPIEEEDKRGAINGVIRTTVDEVLDLMGYQYGYDDSGNITSIVDANNSSQRECFEYDLNNRLTEAFTGNSGCTAYSSTGWYPYDQSFSYDNLHNITSFDGTSHSYGSGNESGSGDAGPHAVVSAGSVTFAYDDNGNRISRTESGSTIGYSYNWQNRLASVDLPSDPDDVEFVYDADGARVSRSHGDYSTIYVAGLMEIDLDTTTVTETRTFYAFAGTPVAVRTHEDPATTLVVDNHLGSFSAAWNDTDNLSSRLRYYPWGAERAPAGTPSSDHRYTGQISDDTGAASGDTGLLYYNARYYDPTIGAFVAADTAHPRPSTPVDLNRYLYVRANPSNATDPTGHIPVLQPMLEGEWTLAAFRARAALQMRSTEQNAATEDWDLVSLVLQGVGGIDDAMVDEALAIEVIRYLGWQERVFADGSGRVAWSGAIGRGTATRPVLVIGYSDLAPDWIKQLNPVQVQGWLKAVGWIGDGIEVVLVGGAVYSQMQQGDYAGAADTLFEGAASFAGGAAGIAAVAPLLPYAAACGPLSVACAVVIVGVGGFAGSEMGRLSYEALVAAGGLFHEQANLPTWNSLRCLASAGAYCGS